MRRTAGLRRTAVVLCTILLTTLLWTIASPNLLAQASAADHPVRPPMPVRDPHGAGSVPATELPDGGVPSAAQDGNFLLGPNHPPAPESQVQPGVPQGTVRQFTMNSADSCYYPGIARDPNTFGEPDPNHAERMMVTSSHKTSYSRTVTVYIPQQYVPGTAAPLLVGADGPDRLLFTVLDNLIAAKRIPVLIAVSIGNGGGDAQGSERGLEYDTMSGRYAEFVENEVLPMVERLYKVRLTHNPNARATIGNSSGGAAALAMAWYHPEWYRRVLAYSGTFVNQQWPWNPATPHGAWGFHETLIPSAPRKPLRLWLEVGDSDLLNPNVMRDDMHDWVDANQRMARVLQAKGYHYQFVFARNAAHVDRATRAQTLPEALVYLWSDNTAMQPIPAVRQASVR